MRRYQSARSIFATRIGRIAKGRIALGVCMAMCHTGFANAQSETELAPGTGQRLPKWEIGAGIGAMSIPYYRGSAQSTGLIIPLIVPVYRGERIQVDRRGIRGLLFRSNRWALDLSADGNVPADSDDLEIREGMPDLAPSVQIGPSLKYTAWTDPVNRQILRINLPVRAVFALDSGIEGIGYTLSPSITYARNLSDTDNAWRLGLYAGLEYGSERFHDYYYQVDDEFSTPARPTYDAQSGYGGIRLATSLRRRTRHGSFAVFARYDRFDSASFLASPLVDSKDGVTVGFFFVRRLHQSKETVPVGDR